MLKKLTIKDYALIHQMEIQFVRGLNIMTGETGAGKSIIIGALNLILGDRARASTIRKGASMTVVEALFQVPAFMQQELKKLDVQLDGEELILRREVSQGGRSRSFANDSPIPMSVLSGVGDLLIDLHGQHEHQALLKPVSHIEYLDRFGVDSTLVTDARESYKRLQTLEQELNALKGRERLLKEKEELLAFQVQHISQVHPADKEDDALLQEEKILNASERIMKSIEQIKEILYDGEGSVCEKASVAEGILAPLIGLDERFQAWSKECNAIRISAEEIAGRLQSYGSGIDFNPARLEEIRERLGQLTLLKKKYGGSLEEVLKFWQHAKEELDRIGSMSEEITRYESSVEEERCRLSAACKALSLKRQEAAVRLQRSTMESLEELGLKNGVFQIHVSQKKDSEGAVEIDGDRFAASASGIDNVEFFIALNPGEDPKPLSQVASGGEISRIMLALKTVLAETDDIPILVFDEIDSGISGRIAWVVGHRLKDVASKHQVICITHLPQIASMGDIHFSVEKSVSGDRSVTTIRPLNREDRVLEIAKLLGGEKVTESSLQSARELLES